MGDENARAIYLTFSGLKFDGRSSATAIGNLDTKYGTTKAIFSRATVLNSFLYAGESSGAYTFTIANDWNNSSSNPPHNVTYGAEITTSREFADLQKKYSGSTYYTHPTTYRAGSEYNYFSTYFLPYVYTAYNLAESKHEISVNVTFTSEIKGCGKYGDPYIIDDNNKLPIIAKIIKGDNVGSTVQIWLPTGADALPADGSSSANFDYTGTTYTKYLYNFGTSTFTSSDGYSQATTDVRQYLAGAYYVITRDITLPNNFVSLGVSGNNAQYAFRGVLIGRNITITNASRVPLITNAMGCVVKNLTVEVNVTYGGTDVIAVAAPANNTAFSLNGGIATYGAVIGKVLGGDNIIDNVQVTFTNATFNITKGSANNYERLAPIGGYVGALVNGGLIFRNMSASNVGLTKNYLAGDAERELPVRLKVAGTAIDVDAEYDGFLYINPIIGRVLAGYAFYEGEDYHATEETATLKNGKKNYTIADLSLSEGKLGVARNGDNFDITVPDGQAMFILGAIVNSGAGSADYNGSTEGSYQALTLFWQAYRQHTTTRAGATYNAVGDATDGDYTGYAVYDAYNPTETLSGVPYIVRAYTVKDGSVYSARCIATTSANVIKVTGTCDVAAGFRGIGSIYYDNDYTRLRISKMAGMNGETLTQRQIILHMDYREYDHKSVSAYREPGSNTAGIGLFNRLYMTGVDKNNENTSDNAVQYLTLSGSVFYDVYTTIGEIFYTPVFSTVTAANYTVTWKNGDATIYSETVTAGYSPVYDDTTYGVPTKAADAEHTYIFIGWNTVITNSSNGAVTCTAQFAAAENGYRAIWKKADDSLFYSENLNAGVTPVYNQATYSTPTKDSALFVGWVPKIEAVAGVQSTYAFGLHYGTTSYYDRDELGSIRTQDDNVNIINRKTYLSAGGLAGVVRNKYYIKNVTFDDLTVNGAKNAGGLIGYVYLGSGTTDISYIDFTDVTATGVVNVTGGLCAGGLIGKIYEARNTIYGKTGTGTDLTIGTLALKSRDPNEYGMKYFANVSTGVGGVVGSCWAANKSAQGTAEDKPIASAAHNPKRLFISYLNIVGSNNAGSICVLHDSGDQFNYAGGYVGSAHTVYLKVTNCKVQCVNISANAAGGIVGRVTQQYYLDIVDCSVIGVPDENINKDGTLVGGTVKSTITGTRCAGGVVGWAVGRDEMYFQLLNFKVQYYGIEATTTSATSIAGAGGAVGYAEGNNVGLAETTKNFICQFNNLSILGCDIKTNYATPGDDGFQYKVGTGGILGVIDSIKTANSDNGDARINQAYYANTSNRYASNNAKKYKFSGYNILVKDCTLTHLIGGVTPDNTALTAGGDTANRRIGDIVGNNAVETPLKLVGVSVENTGYYVDASTNAYCGKHAGYYGSDTDNYGTSNNTGTYGNGYVVFANFNGITGGTTLPTIDEAYYAGDDCVNVSAVYPYATVNPTLDLGTGLNVWHLTGDGIAADTASLAIRNILSDCDSNSDGTVDRNSIYYYAASAYYTGNNGDTNYSAFNTYAASKLSVFKAEVSGYLGANFAVLIVDDTDHTTTHKLVNSYLRLLTNTKHDFGVASAGNYSVMIYNMVYEDGVWTPYATDATPRATDPSLKCVNGEFCMTPNAFDSGKTQFSLIDVRFFDPANAGQVAYHLYVPVFVKKVLSYRFDIAAHGGTEYLKSAYTSDFGVALIENIGTPATFFFRYTYSKVNADAGTKSPLKTTGEWQTAINAGDNVHWNYSKNLQFYKPNANGVLDDLPDDTVLVLIDPNDGGKPYYAKLREYTTVEGVRTQTGGALWGNQLRLGAFKDTMSKDGSGNIVISGTAFTPQKLDKLMGVTATPSNSGTMMQCPENEATVMVGSQGYRLITAGDSPGTKYTITVPDTPVMEQYYISIFTESNPVNDLLFHYYIIQGLSVLEEAGCPLGNITDTEPHTQFHLIMGKIFYHSNLEVESDPNDNGVIMSSDNNVLPVHMNVTLGLADSLSSDLKANVKSLVATANVYQGFLVYLNRVEGGLTSKAILGDPTGSGTYTITKNNPLDPDPVVNPPTYGTETAYPSGNIGITQNLAQFRTGDLSAYFATGNKFVINADVALTYTEAAIPVQFPGRSTAAPDNGVWITCSSNIAFSEGAVTNSKNRILLDEDPKKTFYSEALPDVATLDLNPLGDRVGDFTPLGINAANNEGRNTESFDLYTVLDISTIAEQVEGYHHAYVVITLSEKQDNGTYTAISDISQYMTGIKLADRITLEDVESSAFSLSSDHSSYTKEITAASGLLDDNRAEITLPLLRLTVKTGGELEGNTLTYGNYRVNVAVELRDEYGSAFVLSHAENFVIYSNVRVIPSFLENN